MNLLKGSDKKMYLQLTQANYDYLIDVISKDKYTTVEIEINRIISEYIRNKDK